ncbi:hypothetical protein [Marinobacter sp. CHS3-4]|uniref:hypothetical protein n=1 Tax=Marinobacter sp. CHS3-4 TaxID=3045174 RepID=UPI0024B481B3|nr:hypothetical protein [Marinobacter sp. CHS3-4]MDI9246013.1 hypothetical protein [Marinobacter sp. CHS3-4]
MKHLLKTAMALAVSLPLSAQATDFVITNDADFALGTLQSLNFDAPNSDQLQISQTLSTFPVLWIANAGEDTVSRIDTDNDCETARYETWFNAGITGAFGGPAPSRTAVDADGNVFVANRHFDRKNVAVLKILLEGGIDRNGNGIIDTSADTNGDCVIQPGEMIPLVDTNGNGVLEDSELADERVAFIEQIPNTTGHLGRSLCIDNEGDIWAGTFSPGNYYELSPVDGTVMNGPISTGTSNYGCVVDSDGILFGASLGGSMPIVDTNTKTLLGVRNHGLDYGIAAGNGKIYKGRAGSPYLIYNPNSGPGEPDGNPVTGTFSTPPVSASNSLGIGVDGNGDVIQGNTIVRKYDGDTDTLIWETFNPSGNSNTRGIIADSSNNIWAVNLNANNVTKFRGTDGQFLNTVPVGNGPYTYSDATGIGFQIANPNGTFIRVVDGGAADTEWDVVRWNTEPEGSVPAGGSISVEARSANTVGGLSLEAYAPVSNGATGLGLMGQFIQLRAVLTPGTDQTSPVLSDIVVSSVSVQTCDQDGDGDVDRNDIGIISAARNTTALPGDPRDIDGNGIIDVNDARQCAVQCTRSRCAP